MKEIEQNREGQELFRAINELLDKASRDYQSHEGTAAERLHRRKKSLAVFRQELDWKRAEIWHLVEKLEKVKP